MDEKAMAPPKPKAGEGCNVLAHGRCLHKHGALPCAMYGVETRLIIHVAVLQTRPVGNNASSRRGVTGSCLAGTLKKVFMLRSIVQTQILYTFVHRLTAPQLWTIR